MGIIAGIFRPITMPMKRCLHRHGHGVHSPLAYRLLRDVLYLPHSYSLYCYHEIDLACRNMPGRSSGLYKEACRFARLVAFLNPSSVFISTNSNPLLRRIIARVAPGAKNNRTPQIGDTDLIYITDVGEAKALMSSMSGLTGNKLKAILFNGINIDLIDEILLNTPGGIHFHGKKRHLVIISPDIQKVSYSI